MVKVCHSYFKDSLSALLLEYTDINSTSSLYRLLWADKSKFSGIKATEIGNYLDRANDFFFITRGREDNVSPETTFVSKADMLSKTEPKIKQEFENCLYMYFDDSDFGEDSPTQVSPKPIAIVETLKCSCYYCEKDIVPYQYYDFSTGKYNISFTCRTCNRTGAIQLSDAQIAECNKQGQYQAFMGM